MVLRYAMKDGIKREKKKEDRLETAVGVRVGTDEASVLAALNSSDG